MQAQHDETHVAVVAFRGRLGPAATRARRLAVHVVSAGVQGVLLYHGSLLAYRFWNDHAITLPVSMGLLYLIIPMAAGLILVIHAIQVLRLLQGPR